MVLESLQHLDEVLCAEVYDALVTTAKLGISAIPGGITESLGAQVWVRTPSGYGTMDSALWERLVMMVSTHSLPLIIAPF
jgi:hypothetical protein